MYIQEIKSTSVKSNQIQSLYQRFAVAFAYDVHFTNGLFKIENPLLAKVVSAAEQNLPKSIVVAIDGGLMEHHPQLISQIQAYCQYYFVHLKLAAQPIILPGGEAAKNDPELVTKIHQLIEQGSICRHSYVIGIGGGAVLDLVGYAAATAHRGVRLIRVPTTVLAQNDSGVGVKNGINAFGKKNFLGSFAPPAAVLNDFNFLSTLDDRDWRSGIAEAIKVALIKDQEFFSFIQDHASVLAKRDSQAMEWLIYRCSQLHLQHIAHYGDPFEMGSSRPLDFGHWAAHKLEHLTNYELRHGEAVAIGMALDATYSYLMNLLPKSAWQQIIRTLKQLGFNLFIPQMSGEWQQPDCSQSIFAGLHEFQEHLGGELTIMLLQAIGQGIEVHEIDISVYQEAILLVQEVSN